MKIKPITINNFQKGIALSSYFGFEEFRGLNITENPGIAYVNYKLTPTFTGSLPSEPIVSYAESKTLTISSDTGAWVLTKSGKVYTYDNATSWVQSGTFSKSASSASGGFAFWKDYLWMGDGTSYSAFNGSSWSVDFIAALSGGSCSQMVWASDDKLYFPRKNLVGSLLEVGTFDPASGGTYTRTLDALTLPSDMVISCMVEFGNYLAIGANSVDRPNKAYIYLWDKTSTSFEKPLIINADGVNSMIVRNQLLYIQAGQRGDWYISNGTTAQKWKEMPQTLLKNVTVEFKTSPNTVTLDEHGRIKFGFVSGTTGTEAMYPNGVYLLDPDTKALTLDNIVSNGEDGSDEPLSINVVDYDGTTSIVAWDYDNTTFGLDANSTTRRNTGYTSYLTSQYYVFATAREPATLTGYEVHLASALPTNCGVKVYVKPEKDDAWTLWGSEMTGAKKTFQRDENKTGTCFQFKVELTTSASADNTPEFLQLIVK